MTPFEIRLELLKMAKDLMMEQFITDKDRIQQEWNVKVDAAKLNGQPIPDHPAFPAYPTETDIIKKAADLNSFVSQLPAVDNKKSKGV